MKRLSLMLLLTSAAAAQAAPFDVTGAWFRSLPGGVPAGGYFTAQNNSGKDIAITGVSSEGCGMLMMHQSKSTGGKDQAWEELLTLALAASGAATARPL